MRLSLVAVASIVLVGLFSGYLLGGVRVLTLSRSELAPCVGATITARVTVTGAVRQAGRWQSATAVVDTVSLEPGGGGAGPPTPPAPPPAARREAVLLEVESGADDAPVLRQGQILAVKGTIGEPEGESASGFDQHAYLRNQGIEVVVSAGSAGVQVLGSRGGVSGWFDRLRVSARAHLSRGPNARLDEVLQGIVMGDTVGIDEGWVEAFRRSGTAHMLSVSGLHVAALAAIMIGLAKLVRAPRSIGFLLAAAASCLMIPFVGASPPVVRSVVMIVIVLLGRWVGRGRDQWQVLGLAAAVVLGINPYALFDVGFQLSFGAFAGMLVLVAPVQRALGFLPRSVGGNVAVSIAASAGTAPISLAVFGRMSLVAVFANLVVVPVLPVITGLGMASVLAGFIWPGLSTALDVAVSPATAWTVQASRFFAAAPVLEARQLARSGVAVMAAVVAVPMAFALAGRILPVPLRLPLPYYRRTTRWLYVRRPRKRRLASALGVVLVVSLLVLGWVAYLPLQNGAFRVAAVAQGGWPDSLEVRVLDVGQGNAILVRTPDHHALLFDGGPEGCGLGGQLRSLGVTSVDLALISHPHADHFAGLLECIDGVEVKALLDRTELIAPAAAASVTSTGGAQEARAYLDFRARLAESGCQQVLAHAGMVLQVGGLKIHLYAPGKSLAMVDGDAPWALRSGPPGGDEMNSGSIVALLSWGDSDVLLPGDAEADTLERYDLPSVEAIVIAHHGSRGAVSDRFLERIAPELAVISVGEGNTFGHPDPDTVRLLEGTAATVLRTDSAGWVSLDVRVGAMSVTTERRADLRATAATSAPR
jgi:competence protein ComEC